MLEKYAMFLLTTSPVEELTDELAEVVEKFRFKSIDKRSALKLLTSKYKEQVQKYSDRNQELILNFS